MRTSSPPRAPEVELLLRAVAQTAGVADAAAMTRAAAGVTDWKWFRSLAEEHEVAPLVASSFRHQGEDLAPTTVVNWLWEERRRVARRNLYLSIELRSLLDSLEIEGVECRVLKGLPLGRQAFGDPGLRPTADLDILVRREGLEKATRIFIEHGFYGEEALAPSAQKEKEQDLYSRAFGRRDGWVGLDVHWAFARRKHRESRLLERAWTDREDVSVFGNTFPVLSWPHLPIHLAIHGSKHGPFPWPKLKWIADISGLLARRSRRDWNGALSSAGEIGCRRRLLLAVGMARRCLASSLSPELQEALASESRIPEVADELEEHLFSRRRSTPSAVGRVRLDAALRDSVADGVAVVARSVILPSEKEWGRTSLPESLSWLYGPMRALRLIWRYLFHPWRIRRVFRNRVRSDPE